MTEAPCYVRVLKAYRGVETETDTSVDEDEIIYVTAEEGTERFAGYRLSGEQVSVYKENVCRLELPDMRPNELFFVASIADYDSDALSDISFGKYTVIAVSKELDASWYEGIVIGHSGKRLGKAGCFPKSFVVRLVHIPLQSKRNEEARSDRSQMRAMSCADFTSQLFHEDTSSRALQQSDRVRYDEPPENYSSTKSTLPTDVVFREKALSTTIGAQTYAPDGAYALSIYAFRGKNASELSFDANRIITMRRYVDEQCIEGELDGKMGIFPASFVRVIVDLPIAMHPSMLPKSHENAIGMASALFNFTARHNDELSVCEGESVSIVEMINNEWAHCFNPASGRSGIVPLSFLHIYANEDDEKESSEDIDIKYGISFDDSSEIVSALDEHDESALPEATLDADQLDAFFGFSSGWSIQTTSDAGSLIGENTIAGDEERKKPPPRPPPPKLSAVRLRPNAAGRLAPPRPTSLPTSPATLKAPFQRTGMGIDADTTKRRVVEDLIVSELQYLSDIGMWEAEIDNSNALTTEHKAIFTNGIPELKDLSRRLVAQLTQQQGRPFELQCYGHAFMQMRDDFRTTFALHFRCVEAANMLLETDLKVRNALNECVAEMRALGSNVFDAYTAVSRPIQRCLKYPLFIEELIKNTPISHMDHPKLLEALRQMSFLASMMNESKRRKELAQKYKEADQEGFSKRLSKLNMHTVKKKSTRFKYRLSSQIGLVRMQRDPAFDSVVQNLDASERRVCAFLHSVQLYMRLISTQTRRYVDTYTTREKLSNHPDNMTAEIRGFCRNLLQETTSLSTFLDTTVIREAKKFLRLPVTRMIQKRYDKLIDFESAKRSDKSMDDLRVKQGDYEALNKQLKMTLPRIVDNVNARTFTLVDNVISKDSQFFATMSQLYEQLSPEVRSFFIVPYRRFVDPYERRLHSLIAIGRLAKETQSSKLPLISTVQPSATGIPKDSLIEVPQSEYVSNAMTHMTKAEDGKSSFLSGLQQTSASQSNRSQPNAVCVNTAEPNLIDLEENLLDLSSPIKTQPSSTLPMAVSSAPFDIVQETPPTMPLSKNPFLDDSFHHDVSAMQSSTPKGSKDSTFEAMRLDSSDAIFGSLFEDAKTVHLSMVGKRTDSPLLKPLIPSRPTKEDMHASSNQSNEGNEGYSQRLQYDAVSSACDSEQTELFKAEYDFDGADDIQLSIVEGEKLNVLRRSDDEGNSAWWMVQNEEGIVGYVPANYLSPFSTSSHQ